ncbi:LOW QUALITY PROTEIN: HS12A-like protein [Mya arenaria]|uniref:HS12A-like protein n=1 Tax=Mya arenaria TaxID=6604 RepID=A0ABY7F5F3_MYAAR|nr:LOW QUALITY PROTEIN: HS12A-like protein [Mya arenaria]
MALSEPQHKVEAAVIVVIDFGTTFCGYAFMFTSYPTSIYTAIGEEREPSCVLLNQDKNFNAFGKQAFPKYTELEQEEHQSYYFFHHFKMKLYESEKLITRNDSPRSNWKRSKSNGCLQNCLKVFQTKSYGTCWPSKKENLVDAINTRHLDGICQAVHARSCFKWRDGKCTAKPEADALFAIDKPLKLSEDMSTEKFPVEHKYILADLGGGTINICVHEILEHRKLCELYRATGDYAGGHEFEKFFVKLFGAPALDEFRRKFAHTYQDLITSIEQKNVHFHTKQIKSSSYSVVEKFFDSSVDIIIGKLKEILSACSQDDITSLLLVSDNSESPYRKDTPRISSTDDCGIRRLLLDDCVLLGGRLAVMKGAVIMGMKPRNIVQRRAQFTYGFSNSELFLEEEHPKQLKFNLNGETLGEGVFDKLIERGQLLQYQQESSRKFYDTFKQPQIKQIIWHISLWRSYKPGPRYCFLKEDFCDEVGTISMQPPPDGWPDVVHGKRKLIVGETEFTIKVIIKETGEETTAIIDFL